MAFDSADVILMNFCLKLTSSKLQQSGAADDSATFDLWVRSHACAAFCIGGSLRLKDLSEGFEFSAVLQSDWCLGPGQA